jgi:hypothetical protein
MQHALQSIGLDTLPPQLREDCMRMLQHAGASKAASTWAAYGKSWRQYVDYCHQSGVDPLGGSHVVAACFLERTRRQAAERGVGPQAVDNASAAISAFYELAGKASPCAHVWCSATREAARRSLTARKLDREEAAPDDMKRLVDHHLSGSVGLRTRMYVVAAMLCYAGMLRFSDLARVMVHHDMMRFYPDRVELFIFKSKADQRSEGALVPIGRVGGRYCPVAMLEALLQAGGYKQHPAQVQEVDTHGARVMTDAEDVGPLLRAVGLSGGQQVLARVAAPFTDLIRPVSYGHFRTELLKLFQQAGVHKKLGTHSFRIGGASRAVNEGADRAVVQKMGRWKSEHVFEACYARDDAHQKCKLVMCMGLAE